MHYTIDEYRSMRHEDALNYTVFDTQHNVHTSHPLVIRFDGKLAPGSIDNSDLFPMSYGLQNSTLKELDIANEFLSQQPDIESYTFIDIGSGKGRVILYNVYANAPYHSYVGVEIDSSLHEIAKQNLLTTTIELNKEIDLINQDILDYQIPNEPCVLFLFHSFSNEGYDLFISKHIDVINRSGSYLVLVSPQEYDLSKIANKHLVFNLGSVYIYK